jgi:hypothetical protein
VTKKDKRQPRQTREELRSLLLETGRTMLREEGLGTGAESLTFKRVFQRVEEDKGIRVTNASVIRRVWENQAEFQVDVLMAIAQGDYQEDIDTALDEMRPLFAAMDRSTPESRQRAMREMCRVGPGGLEQADQLPQQDRGGAAVRLRGLHQASHRHVRHHDCLPRVPPP